MKIRSIGFNVGVDGRLVFVGEGKRKVEFIKCPFLGCQFYHAMDSEICFTTGKSIAEEFARQAEKKACQEEKAKRQILADRAQASFKAKYLSGWRRRWRDLVFFFGIFGFGILGYNVSLASGWGDSYSLICSMVIVTVWSWFWANKANKYVRRMKARAEEIHRSVLMGGRLDSQTIGSYLKKTLS